MYWDETIWVNATLHVVFECTGIIYNSCNIGTSDLPDMYAQTQRTAGPRAEGMQANHELLICNIALWRAEVSSSRKSLS